MPNTSADLYRLACELAEADSRTGHLAYLRHVVIDSRPPSRFSLSARPWQWHWAAQYAPALDEVTGRSTAPYAGPRCFWRTLARGHDKTTGLGRLISDTLAFSKKPLLIDHAAADEDQAALLVAAMKRECELNPWMNQHIRFTKGGAVGPGGELAILTSDAPSAAGRIPDIITVDEITHWRSRDLWDMLWSSVNKREQTLVVVITNAGVRDSWQWDIKEAAKDIPGRWLVYEAPGRLDSWMSEENIAKDRRLLTPSEARRLLDNEWIDPAEESGYLARADIEACENLGRDLGLVYTTQGKRGVPYWASLDYGPKRDRTALAIVHQSDSGLLIVDKLDVWQGSPDAPVQIADIRSWVDEARQFFGDVSVVADKYELEELIQDLSRRMRVERFEPRGGKGNYEMAELLRSLIVNRQIAWYPGCGSLPVKDGKTETLKDELLGLVTRPMSYGYRFDHEATKHDDRAVAIGMAAVKILAGIVPHRFEVPPTPEKPTRDLFRPRRISAEERGLYGMSEK